MMNEMKSVRETLKERDGISDEEFDVILAGFKEELAEWEEGNGDDPEELIADWFGLEPDYMMDTELGLF